MKLMRLSFVAIMIVLVLRPQGLFGGRVQMKKV